MTFLYLTTSILNLGLSCDRKYFQWLLWVSRGVPAEVFVWTHCELNDALGKPIDRK